MSIKQNDSCKVLSMVLGAWMSWEPDIVISGSIRFLTIVLPKALSCTECTVLLQTLLSRLRDRATCLPYTREGFVLQR